MPVVEIPENHHQNHVLPERQFAVETVAKSFPAGENTRQTSRQSLGASKSWIAEELEKEAFLISLFGVLAGFLLSIAAKFLVQRFSKVNIDLEPKWFVYALIFGLLSGLLDALYPALRAANQDPVKALSYE